MLGLSLGIGDHVSIIPHFDRTADKDGVYSADDSGRQLLADAELPQLPQFQAWITVRGTPAMYPFSLINGT